MVEILQHYWPHILAVFSFVLEISAAIHAVMTKNDVRAAIGWVGVILLSPILGALVYITFGVNRLSKSEIKLRRQGISDIVHHRFKTYDVDEKTFSKKFGLFGNAMKQLGDKLSRCDLTTGNEITLLSGGDEAYTAMLDAIDNAKKSILLETYIFDNDALGKRFIQSLSNAQKRGVTVRVLIDAVGARYSFPSVVQFLKNENIHVGVFNGNIIMGLRLPYANLRTHRKILIVDGAVAFTGGLNIRAAFFSEFAGENLAHDTHFKLSGPVVSDIFAVSAEDWSFTTQERLTAPEWEIQAPKLSPNKGKILRVVPSGPDKTMETNQNMLIGVCSAAEKHIRIRTPYLLPDRELVSALVTAARRGVCVDIVIPENNNLRLVNRAMRAQFDQLLVGGCRIWRAAGTFDHSKLFAVDDVWAYVGSSNLDPRSLRLNFEIDIEAFDPDFSKNVNQHIVSAFDNAKDTTLAELKKRPFISRLIDRIIWLGSPYL